MEQLIAALKQFEDRNNISASLLIHSDGSCGLMEFWNEEDLGSFDSFEKLLKFLCETQYKLDQMGVCLRPCKIK
jgi:hypothetical protein